MKTPNASGCRGRSSCSIVVLTVYDPVAVCSGERQVPLLQAAADLGIAVIASASLMQGQLARGLPNKVREAFPDLRTDAQCAVAFVRGFPTVTAALVGMKSPEHLREQIHAVSR